MKDDNVAFRKRLSQIFNNQSMADIARRLDLPHATIRNYFGGRLPSPDVLIKIARETNVSLNWLLTGSGEMFAGAPKKLDIGQVLDDRIAAIVDQKLAEHFADEPRTHQKADHVKSFDVESALGRYGDPEVVLGEWFKFEDRKYPSDFGVVFFQGWESFSAAEKIDAILDAKKVLDRTLRSKH